MFWTTTAQDHAPARTYALLGDRRLEPADLDAEEPTRARGALAHLKARTSPSWCPAPTRRRSTGSSSG